MERLKLSTDTICSENTIAGDVTPVASMTPAVSAPSLATQPSDSNLLTMGQLVFLTASGEAVNIDHDNIENIHNQDAEIFLEEITNGEVVSRHVLGGESKKRQSEEKVSSEVVSEKKSKTENCF